jgi:hypothetical protein
MANNKLAAGDGSTRELPARAVGPTGKAERRQARDEEHGELDALPRDAKDMSSETTVPSVVTIR